MGKGQSKKEVLVSLSIAIIILFYSLSIGSYFEPDVYRFQDRLTYHQHFKERYFFGEFIDHIVITLNFLIWSLFSFTRRIEQLTISLVIATTFAVAIIANMWIVLEALSLVSLPVIMIAIMLERFLHRSNLFYPSFNLIVNYLLISVIILSILSLFLSASSSEINDSLINIYILVSRFSPILMLLIVLSLPLKIVFNYIYENVSWVRNWSQKTINSFKLVYSETTAKPRYNRNLLLLGLATSIAISVIIVLIPNLDNIKGPIGEDTLVYVNWIEDLHTSSNIDQLSHKILVEIQGGDRPISVLLIYLMSLVLPFSTITVLELVLPVLLAPTLVLSIYFLTRELTPNTLIALFACFLTAISFQVIAGMYAGIFANWISLLPTYVSLVFLLRFLKTSKILNLYLFSVSLVVLLFTHTYTWTIVMFFVFLLAIVFWLRKSYSFGLLKLVFAAALIVVGVDIIKSAITSSTLGMTRDLVMAESTGFGFTQLDVKWSNIVYVSQVYLAGILGNIIFLLLALYGTALLPFKSKVGIFILLFISVAILPLFFANKIILSRVLYDIPFQIPAAFAMLSIFHSKAGKLKVAAIILSMLAVSIYTVYNIASINQNI